jgi:hypothetical protein
MIHRNYVKVYESDCTWVVEVVGSDGKRARNCSPEFYPKEGQAIRRAYEKSQDMGLPIIRP